MWIRCEICEQTNESYLKVGEYTICCDCIRIYNEVRTATIEAGYIGGEIIEGVTDD